MRGKMATALVAVGMIVSVADAEIIFEDNFDSISNSNWTYLRAGSHKGGQYIDSSSVKYSNGFAMMIQDQTDNGPIMTSKPLPLNGNKVLKISRNLKVYYSNRYFTGQFFIFDPSTKSNICTVSYVNYNYDGWNKNSFILGNNMKYGSDVAPVWDKWFDEVLIYDPQTGLAIYNANGNEATGQCESFKGSTFSLGMNTYGWYTDHYTMMDWLKVEQIIPTQKVLDARAYKKASSSNTITSYKSYLKQHPNGGYVSEAKQKINDLDPVKIAQRKKQEAKERAERERQARQQTSSSSTSSKRTVSGLGSGYSGQCKAWEYYDVSKYNVRFSDGEFASVYVRCAGGCWNVSVYPGSAFATNCGRFDKDNWTRSGGAWLDKYNPSLDDVVNFALGN